MGKYLYEEVKKIFELKGYQLIETEYIGSGHLMRYICPVHGVKTIRLNDLVRGSGCRACYGDRERTHPWKWTKIYHIWQQMKQRCYNSNDRAFKNYGARGIVVCDEWKDKPVPFCEWAMANGYEEGLTLDRKDNNGNYEPSNCRWVNRQIQANNRRNNNFLNINGQSKTVSQWSVCLGIPRSSLMNKIKLGEIYDLI